MLCRPNFVPQMTETPDLHPTTIPLAMCVCVGFTGARVAVFCISSMLSEQGKDISTGGMLPEMLIVSLQFPKQADAKEGCGRAKRYRGDQGKTLYTDIHRQHH